MLKFSNFVLRKFSTHAHTPRIKFLGKRSLLNHHKNNTVESFSHEYSSHHMTEQIKKSLAVCPNSLSKLRPKVSQEEIDIINNGGLVNYKDWSKIKVKSKSKI